MNKEEILSPVNSPTTNSEDEEPILNANRPQTKWRTPVSGGQEESSSPTSSTTTTPTTPLSTPSTLHSSKRKSAFLPYRPHATVLTNLQRGNTEATFCPAEVTLSFHERSGQGEVTDEQVRLEVDHQKGRGSTIDFKDSYGFTPLHWAAYYGQLAAVQSLLQAGADANARAPEMVTPLLLASSGGHHEVVRLLLKWGADSTHMDIEGNTALMYAAAGNHPHTCNELLARDPDMTASNEAGDTAYSLAIENGASLSQAVLEQYMSAILAL